MDSAASPETTRQTPRTQDVLPGVQSFLPQDDTGMCLVNQVHMVSPQDWDLIGNILLGTPYPVIKMEWAGRRGSASAGRLCPGSTLYPRAGDPGSAWTNSPSDEGSSSLTHKEISVSNLIQDLKEEFFREDTNPAVSMWTSGVRRTGSGISLPGLTQSSATYHVCDLEQDPYTLCIVALSVKEELCLCIDDRVLVRIKWVGISKRYN